MLEEVSRAEFSSKHFDFTGDGCGDIRRHNGTLRTANAGLSIFFHIFHFRHLIEIRHIVTTLCELRGDERFFPSNLPNIARASARSIGWGGPEGYLIHVEFEA